ncbi:hypothetical protein J4205_02485 [Candidatus Pacearchaeota archaeon]|nr:hypothetical protein [Candidatus Pacearchaeota archaeon]
MPTNKNSTAKTSSEFKKEEQMRQGNVSLILTSYNDIFSDFDPRNYSQRTLSDDFLQECKRAVRDKTYSKEGFDLRLLVPKNKRDINDEIKIKIRLKNHFLKHYLEKKNEIKRLKIEGVVWFTIGIVFSLMAAFIYSLEGFVFDVLFVMLEPAGWFTMWSGLDKIFINSKDKMPDVRFDKKMHTANIMFINY